MADGYVIGAEFWERIPLVARKVDAKTQLSVVISTPRKNFCVLVVLCLDVKNALSWRAAPRTRALAQRTRYVAWTMSDSRHRRHPVRIEAMIGILIRASSSGETR